jgi:hypothetical protein
MARPSHPPLLDYSNYTLRRVHITKLLIMQFFSILPSPHPSSVQISSSAPCSQTPSVCVSPLITLLIIIVTYCNKSLRRSFLPLDTSTSLQSTLAAYNNNNNNNLFCLCLKCEYSPPFCGHSLEPARKLLADMEWQ